VKVKFSGNSKFSDTQLQKLIGSKVDGVFNERKIFQDSQAIQGAYEKAGYKGTAVKYSSEIAQESAKASITFEISEKP
jgi:outer membrane protein assembly factor BamA